MTIPIEEVAALSKARTLLRRLIVPADSPRVPRWIRDEALRCLRHYPSAYRVTEVWGPDVKRFNKAIGCADTESKDEGGKDE